MSVSGGTKGRWVVRAVGCMAVAAVMILVAAATAHASPPRAPMLPVQYNFLSGIPDELAHPGGSLPGSNDFTCKPSPQHPRPVVLVHGTGGSQQTNWGTYVPLLKNAGYCVFALTYGARSTVWPLSAIGGMAPMGQSAAQLRIFIDRVLAATGATKVDIVGHSQGAVLPTYYAKYEGGAQKIDRYVAISSAYEGLGTVGIDVLFPALRALGVNPQSVVPLCDVCGAFDPASALVRKVNAGGSPYLPGIVYTNIATRYDEIVTPYTSGLVPGGPNVTNIVVQDGCPIDHTDHLGIVGSKRAAYFVLNALDPDHPRPVPCLPAQPITGST